jgi:hypothetical protein
MSEIDNNRSLWRSSDQQEFFLIGEPGLLPFGSFTIMNGEDQSLAVDRGSLAPFAVSRKDATDYLEKSLQVYVEAVIRRRKELQLLENDGGRGEPIDIDRVKAFLHSEEAKATIRSLAGALRKAADRIERSPADVEKSLNQLFAQFMREMTAEEQRGKAKNDQERKQRIGIAVQDSIANSLKAFGIGDHPANDPGKQ